MTQYVTSDEAGELAGRLYLKLVHAARSRELRNIRRFQRALVLGLDEAITALLELSSEVRLGKSPAVRDEASLYAWSIIDELRKLYIEWKCATMEV